MNRDPLSNIISSGVLYYKNTVLISIYTITSVLIDSKYGLKYLYPLNLSTIINILLYSVFVSRFYNLGSLTIKSIAIDVHVVLSTSSGCNNLYSLCRECFALLYISQFSTYFWTSFLKLGHLKSLVMSSIIFDIPGCPASLLLYRSCMI